MITGHRLATALALIFTAGVLVIALPGWWSTTSVPVQALAGWYLLTHGGWPWHRPRALRRRYPPAWDPRIRDEEAAIARARRLLEDR